MLFVDLIGLLPIKGFFIMNTVQKSSIFMVLLLVASLLGCEFNNQKSAGYDLKKVIDNPDFEKTYIPLAVLGSGPAGSSAAIYGANARTLSVVFEGNKPGGLLTETTFVENWPGIKSTRGPVIMDNVREQAQSFGAIFVNDTIEKVDFSQWPFVLHTEQGKTYHAFAVVIATGASPRRLNVPGEQEYWGVGGVNTCAVCHAPLYKGQDVVVVGGGDSAIEEAMQLSPYAKKVTILVRKNAMRASQRMQSLLSGYPNIEVVYNREVQKIVGDEGGVTSLEILNNATQELDTMPIGGVFLAVGHVPNTALFKDFIKMDDEGYIIPRGRTQQTSIPGIFAAGEVTDKLYRQAGVSAGQGIIAGMDATAFLKELGFSTQAEQALSSVLYNPDQDDKKGAVLEISDLKTFEETVLKSKVPVIVDFWADYCPSCLQMIPTFNAVSKLFKNDVLFVKVDADAASDIAKKFFVLRVPALLVFKDGSIVARYNETMGIKELTEFVRRFI